MHLSMITLTSLDLDAAARFYGEVLGLPTQRSEELLTVQIGISELRFVELADAAAQPVNHLAIMIPRNRFEQAAAWIAQRVPVIELAGESEFALGEPWHSDSVYFLGPDGIILEFIARHDLPSESNEEFGAQSMLRISEVRIAVANTHETVAQLAEQLGLEKFAGGSSSFAAVGTDDALVIVVDEGRVWFPTVDTPATAGPVQIEMLGAPREGSLSSGRGATLTARA